MDESCHLYDETDLEPHNDVILAIDNTIPQVLTQAQFVFSELPDQKKVHALIAVGTFCRDFSISKERIPSLSEAGLLFSTKRKLSEKRIKELIGLVDGLSEAYHILNKKGIDFSDGFKKAWDAARSPYPELKNYQLS